MNSDLDTRVGAAVREHVDGIPLPPGDLEMVLARAALSKKTDRSAAGAWLYQPPSTRARWRWLVPAAAAAAVLAVAAVSLLVPRQDSPPTPAGPVPWLPRTIEVPDEPPPPIPADRGVGKGSVIYQTCVDQNRLKTCRDYLITEDREHYEIPGSYDKFNNHDEDSTLSPDGRWLGVTRKGEYRLRDLTSGRTFTYPSDYMTGLAWSSNSRWLVIGKNSSPGMVSTLRVDTRTGKALEVPVPAEWRSRFGHVEATFVLDVTRGGKVLFAVPGPPGCHKKHRCMWPIGSLPDIAMVDPDRGSTPLWTRKLDSKQIPVDRYHIRWMQLTPDDGSVLVAVTNYVDNPVYEGSTMASGDLVLFDLATGELTRRYDVIDGTVSAPTRPAPSGEPPMPVTTEWRVFAHEGDGILLRRYQDHSRLGFRLDYMDPVTGEQSRLFRSSEVNLIAVRGTTTPHRNHR